MWQHKILPLCLAKAQQFPNDKLIQRTLSERAFVSIGKFDLHFTQLVDS